MRRAGLKHTLLAILAMIVIVSMFASAFVFVPQPVVEPQIEKTDSTQEIKSPADPLTLAEQDIIGSWKRTELENQVVVYNSQKEAEVFYGSKKADEFSWSIERNDKGEMVITEQGTSGPARKYVILNLDSSSLQLRYLATGQILNYTRQ